MDVAKATVPRTATTATNTATPAANGDAGIDGVVCARTFQYGFGNGGGRKTTTGPAALGSSRANDDAIVFGSNASLGDSEC